MIKERNKRNGIECSYWLSEEKKKGNRKKMTREWEEEKKGQKSGNRKEGEQDCSCYVCEKGKLATKLKKAKRAGEKKMDIFHKSDPFQEEKDVCYAPPRSCLGRATDRIVGREVSFMCEMRERENIQEMYKDDR